MNEGLAGGDHCPYGLIASGRGALRTTSPKGSDVSMRCVGIRWMSLPIVIDSGIRYDSKIILIIQ